MNLILNECETLRDLRIYKHSGSSRWIVALLDPMSKRGPIMTIDDGGASLMPPTYGTAADARRLSANGERRYVLPLMPAGVSLTAMGLAREHRSTALIHIELWQWLREVLPVAEHGARMGHWFDSPWVDVPVRVAAMPLDRGGFTPDGTYYGLRRPGMRLYALHQQRPDCAGRRLVSMLDADCRSTALVQAKAWADERGLAVYRMPTNV